MTNIFELDSVQEHLEPSNNVLLVDAFNLAFRYKHKRVRDFAADYVRTVESLASSYNCYKIIICADKGQSSYRRGVYPEYKANRKEKIKNQTEEEKKEFEEFIEDYQETLDLLKIRFQVFQYGGVEADDIIASICQLCPDSNFWIISTDKDLDQLIDDRVSRFCYTTRKEVTDYNFEDKYGCRPDQYISIKVLQGDKGDNVPGIPLVGEKRAASLVQQYGSAFNIYDAIPLEGKAKYIQNINNFKDQILVNYELMDLCFSQEALGEDNLKSLKGDLKNHGLLY